MRRNPTTKPIRRTALAAMMFLGAYLMTAVPLSALFGFQVVTFLIPLIAAIAAGRYAWVHTDGMPKYAVASIIYGAALFGGIGFTAGFFASMIFAPDANQGPLLGIFVTGPAGVLIGAIAGLAYGLMKFRALLRLVWARGQVALVPSASNRRL